DLAVARPDLARPARSEADRLLARPTDGANDPRGDAYSTAEATPICSEVVCVHYVTTTGDKPAAGDLNSDGVPDYAALTLATATYVHQTYVGAGYRAPKSDGNRGGDARVDVYLKDIGKFGLYGYCATDNENIPANRDVPAYCVVDNDYASNEFPDNTPRENLEVTLAHEYFHAVQFGYDYGEDAWFMEATATWAEDEVFDDVNDNVQYLSDSPMTRPSTSMDQFTRSFHYGTWIFFRHLTEQLPQKTGAMPSLVREMWELADDGPGGKDRYSLQAIKQAVAKRGVSLTEAFASFAQANRMPGRSYTEGKSSKYPGSKLDRSTKLTQRRRTAPPYTVDLDHLTSSTIRYVAGIGLGQRGWRLRIDVDLSSVKRRTAAVVTIFKKGGAPQVRSLALSASGEGSLVTKFSNRKVSAVEVTLVNAGDHFVCRRGTRFSCSGRSKDDDLGQRVTATVEDRNRR
ncbi:MAG: MXAN_6640 family putative metalloprotease, partial [Nocardioides sp.]